MAADPDKAAQRRIRRWILEQRYEALRADRRGAGEPAGPAQSASLPEQAE